MCSRALSASPATVKAWMRIRSALWAAAAPLSMAPLLRQPPRAPLAISKIGLHMDDHKPSPTTKVHGHFSLNGKMCHSPKSTRRETIAEELADRSFI